MREAKYMVGLASRPARFFEKTGCPDPFSRPARRPFFEKSGRPPGQPTMYLAPPIHFWGIILVLVYCWIYFPYYGLYYGVSAFRQNKKRPCPWPSSVQMFLNGFKQQLPVPIPIIWIGSWPGAEPAPNPEYSKEGQKGGQKEYSKFLILRSPRFSMKSRE